MMRVLLIIILTFTAPLVSACTLWGSDCVYLTSDVVDTEDITIVVVFDDGVAHIGHPDYGAQNSDSFDYIDNIIVYKHVDYGANRNVSPEVMDNRISCKHPDYGAKTWRSEDYFFNSPVYQHSDYGATSRLNLII